MPVQWIKSLEQQLADAQQRAEFLEAVVEVLKRDYGVSLVKNPWGKSSKKNKVMASQSAIDVDISITVSKRFISN